MDNQLDCEKIYHLNVQNNSSLVREINFYSNPDSEWLELMDQILILVFLIIKNLTSKVLVIP